MFEGTWVDHCPLFRHAATKLRHDVVTLLHMAYFASKSTRLVAQPSRDGSVITCGV